MAFEQTLARGLRFRQCSDCATRFKNAMPVPQEILIPFNCDDRLETLLPQFYKVVRPGSKVIFLVSNETGQLNCFLAWLTENRFVFGRVALNSRGAMEPALVGQAPLSDRRIVGPITGGPELRGIDVSVELYSGSLISALEKHLTTGQVGLILTHSAIGGADLKCFPTSIPYLSLLRRPRLPSVLLLDVDRMAMREG